MIIFQCPLNRNFRLILATLILVLWSILCLSQSNSYSLCKRQGHKKLDSIAHQSNIAQHFAFIYTNSDSILDNQIRQSDTALADFSIRFADKFMDKFIYASDCYAQGKAIPAVWQSYFSNNSYNELTYWLLGINAHINGDMAITLASNFSLEELKKNRKGLIGYNVSFDYYTQWVLQKAAKENERFKRLHHLSLGLDKVYAKFSIHKWRKRAYETAIKKLKKGNLDFSKAEKKCKRRDNRIIKLSRLFLD
jgi:hypothetical protein